MNINQNFGLSLLIRLQLAVARKVVFVEWYRTELTLVDSAVEPFLELVDTAHGGRESDDLNSCPFDLFDVAELGHQTLQQIATALVHDHVQLVDDDELDLAIELLLHQPIHQ